MNAFTEKNLSTQNIEPEHEPIFMQYVSAVSGRVYNDDVVDHLADMLLIFYCGGGTALGAIAGGVTRSEINVRTLETSAIYWA